MNSIHWGRAKGPNNHNYKSRQYGDKCGWNISRRLYGLRVQNWMLVQLDNTHVAMHQSEWLRMPDKDAKDVRAIISLRGTCCSGNVFFSQKARGNKSILNLSLNCATYVRGQVVSRSLIGRPEITCTL